MSGEITANQSTLIRHRLWWQLFALIVVTTIAVSVGQAFEEQFQSYIPESRPMSSVFNKKASGWSGCSELLNRLGFSTHAWLLPYRQLRGTKGVLVIVNPSQSLEQFEVDQILSWVEAGNDLIFLDQFSYQPGRRLLEELSLVIHDQKPRENESVPINATSSPEDNPSSQKTDDGDSKSNADFAHVSNLVVTADTKIMGGIPLVKIGKNTIFSVVEHGKGRVLIGTSPTLCANRRFADTKSWGNFQFFVNWLATADGDVLFDERCHGFSENGNIFIALAKSPAGAATGQLFLILAVGVIGAANRFGALGAVREDRKISNLEFITGLSNAYRRAHANSAILEIMSVSMRAKICKFLALSPHESPDKIDESWEVRAGKSISPSSFFTELEHSMQQKQVPDITFKALVSNYDKIYQRMEELSAKKVKKRREPLVK